jgi:general secretion pathway protein J
MTGRSAIPPSQSGFTLVEILVTLVIVAMVSGVVFGSLQQVFNARARLRPYLDNSQEIALGADWFRKTVRAMLADYDDGVHLFSGSVKELSGLTASPLLGPAGTPTSSRWQFKQDAGQDLTVLEYQENNKTVQILKWAGENGVFAYYAEDGKWHTSWPPQDVDQGKAIAQLPQLVRLSAMAGGLVLTIVAAPRAARIAPRPPPPLLGERRVQ